VIWGPTAGDARGDGRHDVVGCDIDLIQVERLETRESHVEDLPASELMAPTGKMTAPRRDSQASRPWGTGKSTDGSRSH
jgi:UDP-N-acetyl-D-mannosaminuronate dehydrogenase